jgi:hypothetical protein
MNVPTYKGKRLTPRFAIRDFCRWCNGGSPATCVSPECSLFPYRLTKPMPNAKESSLRAIHSFCLGCVGNAHLVHGCTAYKSFSEVQPECSLWPHREGKRLVTAKYRTERREQAKDQRKNPGAEAGFISMLPALCGKEG